jgi:hypothetical protein
LVHKAASVAFPARMYPADGQVLGYVRAFVQTRGNAIRWGILSELRDVHVLTDSWTDMEAANVATHFGRVDGRAAGRKNNASTSPLEDSLAVPLEKDACTKEFVPLREEAVARGKLIKAASERHAGVAE